MRSDQLHLLPLTRLCVASVACIRPLTFECRYLYAQCKRFKHEAFGEMGRAIHDLSYEIAACSQSPVDCKKVRGHRGPGTSRTRLYGAVAPHPVADAGV